MIGVTVSAARDLLGAKDLADAALLRAVAPEGPRAGRGVCRPAHFSREFRRDVRRVAAPVPADPPPRTGRLVAANHRPNGCRDLLCGRVEQRGFVHDELPVGCSGRPPLAYRASFPPAAAHVRDPALRGPCLRPPAEPHVSRRPGRRPAPRLAGTTERRTTDDQDRQRPVLGPRPGRGPRLLHPHARLGGPRPTSP